MEPWNMTPRKAIHALANSAVFGVLLGRRQYGPGWVIEHQSEEVRALLQELRSDDVADVAPHVIAWMCAK